MSVFALMRDLAEAAGPSGFERPAAEVLMRHWRPYVDDIAVDRLGSVLAVKRGQGNGQKFRLMLAGHLDEIGLMVKKIVAGPHEESDHGFLRVTGIGGVDIRHLYGQKIIVHGSGSQGGELVGVLGSLPGRMLPDQRRNKPFDLDTLVADVGLPVEELRRRVRVGDFITFHQPLRRLLNGRVTGKALDDRASLVAITLALAELDKRRHEWDVIAVATAQEETTFLGAYTSAFSRFPDVAVAVDVTFGKGPGVGDDQGFELGDGPTIGMGPNVHYGVFEALREAAKRLEMKADVEPHAGMSGTDAVALQIAREGIPTGLVAIPVRNMHSPVEAMSLSDVERAGRLLAEFAANLDDSFRDGLIASMMDR